MEDAKGPIIPRLAAAKHQQRVQQQAVKWSQEVSPIPVQRVPSAHRTASAQSSATPRPGPIVFKDRTGSAGGDNSIEPYFDAVSDAAAGATALQPSFPNGPTEYSLPGLLGKKKAQGSPTLRIPADLASPRDHGLQVYHGSTVDISGRIQRMVTFGGAKTPRWSREALIEGLGSMRSPSYRAAGSAGVSSPRLRRRELGDTEHSSLYSGRQAASGKGSFVAPPRQDVESSARWDVDESAEVKDLVRPPSPKSPSARTFKPSKSPRRKATLQGREMAYLSSKDATNSSRRFHGKGLDERMSMTERQLSYAGEDGHREASIEVSPKCISALHTPRKDRQHDELQAILDTLDACPNEPFASMNDFEKLKVAQIAAVEVVEGGKPLVKRREPPKKLFLLLKGKVSVFDFTEGIAAMERKRDEALDGLRASHVEQKAAKHQAAKQLERLQEEWELKEESTFGQLWRMTDGNGAIVHKELPEGTRSWALGAGAVFGSGVLLPQTQEAMLTTAVCTPGSGQQCVFLTLDKANMQLIIDLAKGKYAEKAQLLRSIKLCAGVSKLTIKMLAMNVKAEQIPPNKVIVEQGTAPTQTYIIRRGFVRVVRKVQQSDVASGLASMSTVSSRKEVQEASAKGAKPSILDQQFVEVGLLGPTQFFGAVSVLELGKSNIMQAHLVSCRIMDVYTLSRLDVGKVSYEDREIMLTNARKQEGMIVKSDAEIIADFRVGRRWEGFRSNIMGGVTVQKQLNRKEALGFFEKGAPSGVRSFRRDEPPLEERSVGSHPFSVLGSVVIGYYEGASGQQAGAKS